MAELSVLMSIYAKEKPEYLRQCFDSLLNQTVKADEWVIVEDGPLTPDLYSVLEEYELANPGLIKRIPLEKNQGLGLALSAGVPECKNELIARMDTDDICLPQRFEKQLDAFLKNNVDIVGTQISEFEGSPENIVDYRLVPLTDSEIREYQKTRSAFNHVSVMLKKSSVLRAGNYKDCPLMEDDLMWADMFNVGCQGLNLEEALVNVRVGSDMIKRRGGWDYFRKYYSGRKRIYDTGFISFVDFLYTVIIQLVVALVPDRVRTFVFKQVLRTRG